MTHSSTRSATVVAVTTAALGLLALLASWPAGVETPSAGAPSLARAQVEVPEPQEASESPESREPPEPAEPEEPEEPAAIPPAKLAAVVQAQVPAPTPVASRVRALQPDALPAQQEPDVDLYAEFEPRKVSGDVNHVDFRNNISYPVPGSGLVVVTDGVGSLDPAIPGSLVFTVRDVTYGDLTGNGSDEAAVWIEYRRGDDPLLSSVHVFGISAGVLDHWGSTWGGHDAYGGVSGASIDDERLIVRIWSTTLGDCCPNGVGTTYWSASDSRSGLTYVDVEPHQSWMDTANSEAPYSRDLSFLPGTISAVVASSPDDTDRTFTFSAEPGQVLQLGEASRAASATASLRVRHEVSGTLLGVLALGETMTLSGDGRYVAEVVFDASATADVELEIGISDLRTLRAPTWLPRSEVIVSSENPRRETSVMYPEFTHSYALADLDVVNARVRQFVYERRAAHNAQVPSCYAANPSHYNMHSQLTLVSYDLVSILFTEYSSLCRSNHAATTLAMTIDLNTGKIVEGAALVEQGQAISQLFWDRAPDQNWWVFDDVSIAQPAVIEFEAYELTANGITLHTAEGSINGIEGSLIVALTFEELGALADPVLATRARTGEHYPFPQTEGCGC